MSFAKAFFLFLSTPSARRATIERRRRATQWQNFYPRPPRGGRRVRDISLAVGALFLSTPSARRATSALLRPVPSHRISIHALREEGDTPLGMFNDALIEFLSTPSARRATQRRQDHRRRRGDFYPRPPRGGRLEYKLTGEHPDVFLSTPSARRATPFTNSSEPWRLYFYPRPPRGGRPPWCRPQTSPSDFYPRPPRGGRPPPVVNDPAEKPISIHALREEGDARFLADRLHLDLFLSTPSARRATQGWHHDHHGQQISIHALREEGDEDLTTRTALKSQFLSTPSARRATSTTSELPFLAWISIHALREEGDIFWHYPAI